MQPLWRTAWKFLKKLKIELPYDTATPLLGIYLEKTIIQKGIWNPMFTASLFTVAKTWKQPRWPPTGEWIKKMWCIYIYVMKYYSAVKKKKEWMNEIMSCAALWMDLEMIPLSEITQTNIIWYHLYVESKKKKKNKWTYLQNRKRQT